MSCLRGSVCILASSMFVFASRRHAATFEKTFNIRQEQKSCETQPALMAHQETFKVDEPPKTPMTSKLRRSETTMPMKKDQTIERRMTQTTISRTAGMRYQ